MKYKQKPFEINYFNLIQLEIIECEHNKITIISNGKTHKNLTINN